MNPIPALESLEINPSIARTFAVWSGAVFAYDQSAGDTLRFDDGAAQAIIAFAEHAADGRKACLIGDASVRAEDWVAAPDDLRDDTVKQLLQRNVIVPRK